MEHPHHEDQTINNTSTDPICAMVVIEASNFFEKVKNKTFFKYIFNISNIVNF